MSVLVVLGLQWGDEGKGKIIDWLSAEADVVARFQGGNNAGHTIHANGRRHILHLVPSGILHEKPQCLIGNGVVVNPYALRDEIAELEQAGFEVRSRLFLSENAHCLMPHHIKIDQLQEARRGAGKIGTTGRGIGTCYGDKISRHGVRFCEILHPRRWDGAIARIMHYHNPLLRSLDSEEQLTAAQLRAEFERTAALVEPFVIDGVRYLNEAVRRNKKVMCEGAQGVMLDVDFGTYPYVTSSNSSTGGVCTGLGIPPMAITRVCGLAKAYTTRVGAGPFPTEFDEEFGGRVREWGDEYGATTGRPRRCGWLDAALLRRSAQISGCTEIVLSKIDVLDQLDEIKICTGYRLEGRELDLFPFGLTDEDEIEPLYEVLPGWKTALSNIRSGADLPRAARNYITRIEELCGVPVSVVSVGADREQTIRLREIVE